MSDREAFEKWWSAPSTNRRLTDMSADRAFYIWQAAQSQAGQPIAAVTGWYDGRCVIEPLDRALAIPVGMALYSQPQAQAVNQQLLEALDKLISVAEMCDSWESFPSKALDEARAAIAAAQEQSK